MKKVIKILSFFIKYYTFGWKEAFWNLLKTSYGALYIIIWDIWLMGHKIWEDNSILKGVIYFGLSLPLILGELHSFMYPNRLDKTMFLCPIEQEERKLLLKWGYWFRNGCVLFISVLMIICMLATGLIRYSIYLPGFLISEGIFTAVIFLRTNTAHMGQNAYTIWRGIAESISGLSCIFILGEALGRVSVTEISILLVILFIIQISLFLKVMICYWKKEMDMAADYEMSYQLHKTK